MQREKTLLGVSEKLELRAETAMVRERLGFLTKEDVLKWASRGGKGRQALTSWPALTEGAVVNGPRIWLKP